MRYELDPESSVATVHARSSVHPLESTATVSGWIELVLTDDGHVDLTEPVAGEINVDLRAMRSGNGLVDREAERRLHVRKYPTMSGELTDLVPATEAVEHGHRYDGTGLLTFHGETRPLAGGLSIVVDGSDLRIEGETALDVTDYGVQPPSLLVIKVFPEVRIHLRAEATAQP